MRRRNPQLVTTAIMTYKERAEFIDPISKELESIANRLRMGAISDELAASKLATIAAQLTQSKTGKKEAHVSSDPSVVSHCVFCGSGAIVARGDGGVECTLCNRSFSVMEQPLFSNMPSTDPGANIEATPFDPLMQEDAFDPGAQPLQQPGQPAQPAAPATGVPAVPVTQKPPPTGGFPFHGVLVNHRGIALDEEDFVLHHAIRLARELADG